MQTEFVRNASAHDLARLGLSPIRRPVLDADLHLLPVEQRLKGLQVMDVSCAVNVMENVSCNIK